MKKQHHSSSSAFAPKNKRGNGTDNGNTGILFVETASFPSSDYTHRHTHKHLNTHSAGLEKEGSEVALCQAQHCQETRYTLVSSGILITHTQTHTLPSAVHHGSRGELVNVSRI